MRSSSAPLAFVTAVALAASLAGCTSWNAATVAQPEQQAAAPGVPQAGLAAATHPGPGQAGYVHYFLLQLPDGSTEMQIGIELADGRIAWSSPATGVAVTPFIENGTLSGRSGEYRVQHLFGVRPFAGDAAMAGLAAALPARVAQWVDDGFGHCDDDPPPKGQGCVSCLGFVLRLLFPGTTPMYPDLPADFRAIGSGERHTTEDLLVYLAGLHTLPTRAARMERAQSLEAPAALREELLRILSAEEATPAGPEASRPSVARGAKGAARAPVRPRRL